MNRNSTRFLLLLLLSVPLGASAQLEIGVRGGLVRNQVPMDFSDRVFYKSTWENRFSVGVVALYPIVEHLYAESGLSYASKRSRVTRDESLDNSSFVDVREEYDQIDRNYLELPLGLRLEAGNWEVGNSTFSLVLAGGGYGGYWVSGQRESRVAQLAPNPYDFPTFQDFLFDPNTAYVTVTNDYEFDTSYDPDGVKDNRWEFGWYGGVALQYRHNTFGRFWVEGRYQQALTDLSAFEDGKPRGYQDRQNRSVRIDLGYALPLSSIF